jgi:hypothetical protein
MAERCACEGGPGPKVYVHLSAQLMGQGRAWRVVDGAVSSLPSLLLEGLLLCATTGGLRCWDMSRLPPR